MTTNAQRINQDSGKVEYYTPYFIILSVKRTMGAIDLDPASCKKANTIVHAKKYFTVDDDALNQPWFGRVWMNHPFSKTNNPLWTTKLIDEFESDHVTEACCITFASTSEKWFLPLMKYPQCYLSPRLNYLNGSTMKKIAGITKGSVITYFGPSLSAFYKNFHTYGTILLPYDYRWHLKGMYQ